MFTNWANIPQVQPPANDRRTSLGAVAG